MNVSSRLDRLQAASECARTRPPLHTPTRNVQSHNALQHRHLGRLWHPFWPVTHVTSSKAIALYTPYRQPGTRSLSQVAY